MKRIYITGRYNIPIMRVLTSRTDFVTLWMFDYEFCRKVGKVRIYDEVHKISGFFNKDWL